MNDYEGELTEFALVVPVPEVLQRGQVNVGEKALFDHLDAYTAPRLVEYFDEDPCSPLVLESMRMPMAASVNKMASGAARRKSLGVTVEAEYTVGEYDIVILSAKESDGLETWLIESGYHIPKGASAALRPYIKQDMKFFVAKVNLKEQAKTGLQKLRPLQFAFSSEKFMLPIRLGLINAKGPQELLIYVLTKSGRVETTNYRTTKLPTGMNLPVFVKQEFAQFYKAMFSEQVRRDGSRTVFTEYFWNMGWCDPCAADPLSREELKKLGVFWLNDSANKPMPRRAFNSALPVMATRLHLRYTAETFPEDLMFQETKDTQNFQGRYVLRHPWKGEAGQCDAAASYLKNLGKRHEKESQELARLTGWDINEIRGKMDIPQEDGEKPITSKDPWWKNLW